MSDGEHTSDDATLQEPAPPDTGVPELAVLGPGRRVSFASRVRRLAWNLLPNRLLFNPVFWKDSAITARKKGTFAFRGIYMLLLLLVVGIAVAAADVDYWYSGAVARLEAGSQLAWMLTQTIQWTQLFILLLAGPILASGAIANERTNRSLESLYTTPLSNSQIVWGKITARMGYIFIVALLPLPILLMLRALGGIDATTARLQTVIIMTGATLTTSMGMFFSVHAKKPWRAVMSVVSLAVVYHLLLAFVPILIAIMSVNAMNPSDWLIRWCSALSPIISFSTISFWDTWGAIGVFQTDTLGVCLMAVAAQLAMSAVFGSLAVLRLKREAKPSRVRRVSNRRSKQAATVPPSTGSPALAGEDASTLIPEPAPAARRRRKNRRRIKGSQVVSNHPVFWRDSRQPVIELPKLGIVSLLLCILIVFGIGWVLWVQLPDGTRIYQSFLVYVILYAVCSVMLLIASSMRTATLIAHERAARTWESLRTTPMSPWSIVVQKYLGSMAKPFCQAGALLLVMIVPVLLGKMQWTVVPFLGITLFAAMAFLAATGMVFGSIFRKGMLAATVNIGMAAFLWILMPIFAAAAASDGGEGVLLINPAYQTAVTMEGCYNNNMHWSSSNSGGRAFDWYDEMVSASEHAVRLLITLMAALFVVLFALMISAQGVERPDRSR